MTEEQFYFSLWNKTEEAFNQSSLKGKDGFDDNHSHFAVCATPIQKGKGVVFGLNWGGTNIEKQEVKYPSFDDDTNWNFTQRSEPLLKKHLEIKDIKEVNYTNLCFFRSPKISDLNPDDWKSSLELFKEFIKYVNPPWTILLGSVGHRFLLQNDALLAGDTVSSEGGKRTSYGYRGKLFNKYNYACVPHPQARISNDVREDIWSKLYSIEL